MDLEKTERFGASRVEDLTWKSMLDGYTCTECGRCREVCPTVADREAARSARLFIGDVRDAVYEATPGDPRGRLGTRATAKAPEAGRART